MARTLYLSTSQNLQKALFIGEDCKPTPCFDRAKKFKNLDHFFTWVEINRIPLAERLTCLTDLNSPIGRNDFLLCYNNNSTPDRGMCSGIVQHSESKRPIGLITTLRRAGLAQRLQKENRLQFFEGRLVFVRERLLFDSFATSNGEYTNDLEHALAFRDRDALDKYIKHWQEVDDTTRAWCFRKETTEGKRLFNREEPTKFWYPINQFRLCRIHVTEYNTIEFVRVYSEDISNYTDVINKIFYKYPYDYHDDKVDAVATAMKVYSGTTNPYMTKILEKHLLNSMYGVEGLHYTPDGPKPAYDLSVSRWELDESKSKFELDYNLHHPDYSARPEFLTKCMNIPLYTPDRQFKAGVLGDFEPPAERFDYTKMYKSYDVFGDIDPNAGVMIYDGDTDIKVSEKGENDMRLRVPEIKKVIFNKPAVVVLWKDGTKTIVKAQGKSRYDKEKGLAMAIAKKALGNEGNYYNEFRKWLEE